MKSLSVSLLADAHFFGGWVEVFNRIGPSFLTRVLVGLTRPIGQSLIRSLPHIIEFDSGLLIKSSDLRV